MLLNLSVYHDDCLFPSLAGNQRFIFWRWYDWASLVWRTLGRVKGRYILKPERSSENQENHDPSFLFPQITGSSSKPSEQNIQHRRQAKRISRMTNAHSLKRAKAPPWSMSEDSRRDFLQKMKLMQYLNIKKEFRQVEKHLRLNNWQYTEKLSNQENKAIINSKESFLKIIQERKSNHRIPCGSAVSSIYLVLIMKSWMLL